MQICVDSPVTFFKPCAYRRFFDRKNTPQVLKNKEYFDIMKKNYFTRKEFAMIKVCTFNLRINNAGDGVNCFDNRVERICNVIRRERPELIGFQEGNEYMLGRFSEILTEYDVVGCGREKDYSGESASVAILKGHFKVISVENFWLSHTPSVAGSSFGGDQSRCPRITTSVQLYNKDSGKVFRFCNTHLDHKGKDARLLGARQICEHLEKHPEPFVLTGDFNARPESDVIEHVRKFCHEGRATRDLTENISGSFHGFGTREIPTKIDYIFTDAEAKEAYAVSEGEIDGIYVSDHDPLFAEIEL